MQDLSSWNCMKAVERIFIDWNWSNFQICSRSKNDMKKKIPQQLSQSIEQIEKRETTVPNVLHSLYCCVDLKVKTNAQWIPYIRNTF